MTRGKCVVGFQRTETQRVLTKRGINSSEINASLCFFAGVERRSEKKKTRWRDYGKKNEKNVHKEKRKRKRSSRPSTRELYLEIRKKAEHGRISAIREDYLVSEMKSVTMTNH